MKKLKHDGVHYNRKFHRWELWGNFELIYLRNIMKDEDIVDVKEEVVQTAKKMYGFTDERLKRVVKYAPLKDGAVHRKEFKGNVLVTVTEHEARLWVCSEEGVNIFRFKALGKVYETDTDLMVIK